MLLIGVKQCVWEVAVRPKIGRTGKKKKKAGKCGDFCVFLLLVIQTLNSMKKRCGDYEKSLPDREN